MPRRLHRPTHDEPTRTVSTCRRNARPDYPALSRATAHLTTAPTEPTPQPWFNHLWPRYESHRPDFAGHIVLKQHLPGLALPTFLSCPTRHESALCDDPTPVSHHSTLTATAPFDNSNHMLTRSCHAQPLPTYRPKSNHIASTHADEPLHSPATLLDFPHLPRPCQTSTSQPSPARLAGPLARPHRTNPTSHVSTTPHYRPTLPVLALPNFQPSSTTHVYTRPTALLSPLADMPCPPSPRPAQTTPLARPHLHQPCHASPTTLLTSAPF